MPDLSAPVGLGLAARGSVADTVGWAAEARGAGVESVWFHESYFERDAVTYVGAVAGRVADIRVALGAVNPYTRDPTLLAMTVSALDEMAPGRIVLSLGTGFPLRLAQMGIPYDPDDAIVKVEAAMGTLRTLWRGERIAAPTPGLPDLQPMFPPVHTVPIYAAGYRKAYVELAGRAADGYLARPAESIPSLRGIVARLHDAARAAGRSPADVPVAGYLLSLVDDSRAAALNRAKRDPFVIYQLSVQSDVAMLRAGFDPELKARIAAAWRAEDYHRAAGLIPDDLVDAFLLCGTVAEVAAKAEEYRAVGMDLPLLQPIVQEESQVRRLLRAAVDYGTGGAAGSGSGAAPVPGIPASTTPAEEHRGRRRLAAFAEIARPFSFTASVVPVATAGGLAAVRGALSWPLFLLALLASVALHAGTNVVNEIYDVRKGIDEITSPRASHALVAGRITERAAFGFAGALFALAGGIGLALTAVRGWPLLLVGVAGLVGGWGYTAPPLQYKYRALGPPLVFLLMGPLMVVGAYYAITGRVPAAGIVLSVPIGLLVTAILHGNEWRDAAEDARAGISTLSIRYGRRAAHAGYLWLVVGAYVALALAVAVGVLPPATMLATLSLPLLVRALRAAELGAAGQQRAIAMIDLETAQLHAAFGGLLVIGLAAAAAVS